VVALFSGEPDVFDAEETGLVLELSDDISFALDHLGKAAQLHYATYYDLLTGLANRRLFLERVTQYILSALWHRQPATPALEPLDVMQWAPRRSACDTGVGSLAPILSCA
jgi:hypothetical protein